jgi:D-alanine-D-alanine ligase
MDTALPQTTLVVIFGGQSAEHDVSCVTAAHVLRAVNPQNYTTIAIGISTDGTWHLPALAQLPHGGIDPSAIPDRLIAAGEATSSDVLQQFDPSQRVVIFPLIHGPLGEDGTLQGMLEMMNLPYVGSGVLACAVAMDKAMAKTVCAQSGIPQVRYAVLREDHVSESALAKIAESLGYPMFVKPANMGSSVGVSKVTHIDELRTAVQHAALYDEWILVEEAVVGRELEVAVLGNRTPRASVVGEIEPGHDFYDYDDKYVTDSASLHIPARLSAAESKQLQQLALEAYRTLRCEGLARVDFFYEENGRGFLLNEINTIPGFTPISMYPKLWAASGIEYPELIDELVQLAQERHGRQKRFTQR